MLPRSLLIVALAAGLALSATIIPAVFTVDENNYLVSVLGLRDGQLGVPGTERLPPSTELLFFDPTGSSRVVSTTPVTATAPPLYAPLALPFAPLGWRGLVALETLSFLVVALIVFAYARQHATTPATPWLALAAFALGGYSIEYAQGLWPHMLSVALTTGAVYLAARLRLRLAEAPGGETAPDRGSGVAVLALALAAGLSAGLASGLRYQNVVFAGCIGLGILLLTPRRRLASSTAYAAGVALPLAASSLFNHLRLDAWNPLSKGTGYLSFGSRGPLHGFVGDALLMAWARVVDYGARPTMPGHGYMQRDAEAGAWLIVSAVKKAWLQSAPWIVLALAATVGAWLALVGARRSETPAAAGRELRALALILVPVIGMFSAAGVWRTDGLCFNQRYFLELVPLVAVAFAWSLDRLRPERPWLLAGALGGLAIAGVALVRVPGDPVRTLMLTRFPLALAALLLTLWLLPRIRRGVAGRIGPHHLLTVLAGIALGWALAVHLGDDLRASRAIRSQNFRLSRVYDQALPPPPEPSALVFWGALRDAAGPLLIERDLTIVDARNDVGEHLPETIDALLANGRRVLVVLERFPAPVLSDALGGRPVRGLRRESPSIVEVALDRPAPAR